eukprot:scaffold248405_cov65-Cyclotella_meneghiniana.AAC.4
MSRRLNKEILQRTYEENEDAFNSPEFSKALERFNELRAELDNAAETKLTYLAFDEVEDGRAGVKAAATSELPNEGVIEREKREWKAILEPFVEKGDTWLSAPWLVTEFYAYRRLIEAIGYYDKSNPATYLFDPFAVAKKAGLESSVNSAENMLEKIVKLPHTKEDKFKFVVCHLVRRVLNRLLP